jgi:hypothetical protein
VQNLMKIDREINTQIIASHGVSYCHASQPSVLYKSSLICILMHIGASVETSIVPHPSPPLPSNLHLTGYRAIYRSCIVSTPPPCAPRPFARLDPRAIVQRSCKQRRSTSSLWSCGLSNAYTFLAFAHKPSRPHP